MPSKPPQIALQPITIAAYAVLFIYATNIEYARLDDVLGVLVLVVAGSAALFAVLSLVLHDVGRGALAATAIVVIFFFGYYASSLVSSGPSPLLFLLVASVVLAITWATLRYGSKYVAAINTGLTVASVVLLLMTVIPIVPYIVSSPKASVNTTIDDLVTTRSTDRDIFYVIFDRYGSATSLASGLNVLDNDLPDWLEDNAFFVASNAHANYVRTMLSLPATLSLDYLDDVATVMGADSSDYRPVADSFQRHRLGAFLKAQGYRYTHLGNWFGLTSKVDLADRNLRKNSMTEFDSTLYETSAIPEVMSVFEQRSIPQIQQVAVDDSLYQFETLRQIANDPTKDFVFAHILLPHDPFVFNADGSIVPYTEQQTRSRDDLFHAQLAFTNSQIKTLVGSLLAVPEAQQPIIVMQADEGPYPQAYDENQMTFDWTEASAAEVETKFGILDAFYLPSDASADATVSPYDSISSVNTFRLVLDRYFGTNLGFLPDRSYASRSPIRPYDLIDITDRLPGAN